MCAGEKSYFYLLFDQLLSYHLLAGDVRSFGTSLLLCLTRGLLNCESLDGKATGSGLAPLLVPRRGQPVGATACICSSRRHLFWSTKGRLA